MKITLFIFAIFALFLNPSAVKACLYNTSINEFILEDTVPVCFVDVPVHATTADQMVILTAMRDIKQSLQDLDKATSLKFAGYGRCKNRTGKPEIRISLDKSITGGRAVTEPGYSTEEINVFLPSFVHQGNKSDVKVQTNSFPLPAGTYQWLAKHEVLHLFGLQHDHRIANVSIEKLKSRKPSMRALPDPSNPTQPRPIDLTSIMNLNDEDMAYQQTDKPSLKIPQGKLLSDLDVQCIDSIVAEARSQRNSTRPAQENSPTQVISPRPAQNKTRSSR